MQDYQPMGSADVASSEGLGPTPEAFPMSWVVVGFILLGCVLGLSIILSDWRITAVLMAAIILAALAFRYPFAGVLVYLLVAALRPEELGISPATMRLQLVFALVCMAGLLLPAALMHTSQRWEWRGTDKAFAWLYLACWVSVPLSVSRGGAVGACWEFAKLVFAYLMIRQSVTTPRRMRLVVWTLVASVGITALLALYGSVTGQVYIGEGGISRTEGMTSAAGDPDTLANTLILGLPLMLMSAIRHRRWSVKLLLVGLTVLDLYVTTTTGARAGAVSLLVVVFLLALAARRRLLALGGIGLVLLVLWVSLPQSMRDRYVTLGSYKQEVTYQARRESAKVGFRMFRDHPLTGVGVGSFIIARFESYDHIWLQAHNGYAEVAAELGLVGLVAWTCFLISILMTARAARAALRRSAFPEDDRWWLDGVCVAVMVILAGLLTQALASHNFLRPDYYTAAALATSCLALAGRSIEARIVGTVAVTAAQLEPTP